MATFDSAVGSLLSACENFGGFTDVRRACLIRDLQGRLRLVLDPGIFSDLLGLENLLTSSLRGWFLGPILSTAAVDPGSRTMAKQIMDRADAWPTAWPLTWMDNLGGLQPLAVDRWKAYQRVLSKQSWLTTQTPSDPLWPLESGNPAIVAFHSFKGGVGRTTSLAIMAAQLTRKGKKVICIDLDLEAPGLASFLGCPMRENNVLEILLTHAVTGTLPPEDPVHYLQVHACELGVIPAGSLNASYVEKLARLDYVGSTSSSDSPIGRALATLLKRIKGEHKPDFILLDCRAGLHDLGGLSLTDLAHIDVLVARDTPQGRDGTLLVLEILARRRTWQNQRVLMLQTFVPSPVDSESSNNLRERYCNALYNACMKHIYIHGEEDAPAEMDTQGAHYPWPIEVDDRIAKCGNLEELPPEILQNHLYLNAVGQLESLAEPESSEGETP